MKGLLAFAFAIMAGSAGWAAPARGLDALLDYSACTARGAARLDDGRSDFAPIARAVAAECRDSYRGYVRFMEQYRPSEPVLSDRDLAIGAVQYERKFGPAPIARRGAHRSRLN